MVKKLLVSTLLASSAFAGGNFFATVSLGLAQTDISKNDKRDSIELTQDAKDDASTNYEVGFGYDYNSNYFTTLTYSQTSFDNAEVSNILVGVNYRFNDLFLKPYVGILAGNSTLVWEKDPITTIEEIVEDESSQNTYGLQFGGEYKISKSVGVFGQYQMLFHEHTTKVTSAVHDTEIIVDGQNNLNIGLRYNF